MDWQARHDQLCACSLVDIFTSLKRRTTQPPTQALIQRKINSLSLPALETLSLSVENRIVSNHGSRRLSPLQIAGTARAVQFFPTETVAEIAHVHALGEVMSAAAVGSVHFKPVTSIVLAFSTWPSRKSEGWPFIQSQRTCTRAPWRQETMGTAKRL